MAIYGIDLGTTNSLIGMHKTGYLSEIVPSCVNLDTGEAGKTMYNKMDATRSFKVDMSMGTEGIIPRVASQHVLKALVSKVNFDTVKDVVISVPAYFGDSQRAATVAAAKMAGLNVKALVNEPTAAAMYIAKQKKGLFVVYDLGGGTFDCSIIDSRFGAFDVQATEGCKVGGDDFDKNIMRYFIKHGRIPIHTLGKNDSFAIQHFATFIKLKMQKERKSLNIDLSKWGGQTILFTPDIYSELMRLTFSETINCMRRLIEAWIPSTEKYDILLVGGSTHCPFLTEWIESATGKKPAPLDYDPDRVVAQGAALYAELFEKGEIVTTVSDVTKQLSIGLYDGTVDMLVPANSKIPLSVEKLFANITESDKLELDLYQGQSVFRKDNECIGTLVYQYGSIKAPREGQVLVTIEIDENGLITFSANELLGKKQTIVLNRKD